MGVEGRIGLISKTRRNCVSQEESPDVVFNRVRFVFIEGDYDQSLVVIEIGIVQQRGQEASGPVGSIINGGIVAVVKHIRSDKRPT